MNLQNKRGKFRIHRKTLDFNPESLVALFSGGVVFSCNHDPLNNCVEYGMLHEGFEEVHESKITPHYAIVWCDTETEEGVIREFVKFERIEDENFNLQLDRIIKNGKV